MTITFTKQAVASSSNLCRGVFDHLQVNFDSHYADQNAVASTLIAPVGFLYLSRG